MTVIAEFPNKAPDASRHELAARELCRLRGVDPDARVSHGADPSPDGSVIDIMMYSPAWTRVVREIIDADRTRAALAYAEEHEFDDTEAAFREFKAGKRND